MFTVKIRETTYKVKFLRNHRITECAVIGPYFNRGLGYAICHPVDNFCKNTGRKIAMTRAIQNFSRGELTKTNEIRGN